MLEAMATLILVIVGVVLIILILAYGIYITFYPLGKTFKGGIDTMKERVEDKMVVGKQYARTPTGPVRLSRKKKHKDARKREKESKK